MPYVNIKITKDHALTKEQKAALIQGVTGVVSEVLNNDPSTTVVTIDELSTDNWGLGGDPIETAREKQRVKNEELARLAAEKEAAEDNQEEGTEEAPEEEEVPKPAKPKDKKKKDRKKNKKAKKGRK